MGMDELDGIELTVSGTVQTGPHESVILGQYQQVAWVGSEIGRRLPGPAIIGSAQPAQSISDAEHTVRNAESVYPVGHGVSDRCRPARQPTDRGRCWL